jgi:hypothetical protein
MVVILTILSLMQFIVEEAIWYSHLGWVAEDLLCSDEYQLLQFPSLWLIYDLSLCVQ